MATVHVTFRNAVQVGGSSILSREPRAVETLTSSGSSAATTITARQGEVASITASSNDVFIAVGAAPTAVASAGDLVPAGSRLDIGFMQDGDKIAVIDAA